MKEQSFDFFTNRFGTAGIETAPALLQPDDACASR
jgi:hypothetical protein